MNLWSIFCSISSYQLMYASSSSFFVGGAKFHIMMLSSYFIFSTYMLTIWISKQHKLEIYKLYFGRLLWLLCELYSNLTFLIQTELTESNSFKSGCLIFLLKFTEMKGHLGIQPSWESLNLILWIVKYYFLYADNLHSD